MIGKTKDRGIKLHGFGMFSFFRLSTGQEELAIANPNISRHYLDIGVGDFQMSTFPTLATVAVFPPKDPSYPPVSRPFEIMLLVDACSSPSVPWGCLVVSSCLVVSPWSVGVTSVGMASCCLITVREFNMDSNRCLSPAGMESGNIRPTAAPVQCVKENQDVHECLSGPIWQI